MKFEYGAPVYRPSQAKPKGPDFLPVCLTCGYDMRGTVSRRCPECGNTFVESQWERAVRDARFRIDEVESYLRWVPWAWKVALAGILLRLLGFALLSDGFLNSCTRAAALVCGVVAVFAAVNVLRVRQLPTWARIHLKKKPDPFVAALSIGCGLASIASAVFLK